MSTITNTPEVKGLKARLKDTWMAGDYNASRAIWSRPTNRAFASLGESDAKKRRADLEELWSAHNRGGELTVVSSEYLEVIAVKA